MFRLRSFSLVICFSLIVQNMASTFNFEQGGHGSTCSYSIGKLQSVIFHRKRKGKEDQDMLQMQVTSKKFRASEEETFEL